MTEKKKKEGGRKHFSKGISFSPEFYEVAKARADALGLSFSAYTIQCLKRDLRQGGEFTIRADEGEGEVSARADGRARKRSDHRSF